MRRAWAGIGVLGLLLAPASQAAPLCVDPLAVARALFEAGTAARFLDAPDALLSAEFSRAMAGERDCQEREQGVCRLDYDPWLDGQDGDIDGDASYQWHAASPDSGVVEVRFPVWGQGHRTRLAMRRQGDRCWRVDDVVTNRGESVREVLARPVP